MKSVWVLLVVWLFSFWVLPYGVLAQEWETDLAIMQELTGGEVMEVQEKIKEIWSEKWYVQDKIRKIADEWDGQIWKQLAGWIMNWNTIPNYLVFVVQFLSQLWLAVGVLFIMYAWYKYMISVFNGWRLPTETVKNAIIWVIIVIFSYAILKTMTSLIWIS